MESFLPSGAISTSNTVQPIQPTHITTFMRLIWGAGNTDLNLFRLGKALELEIPCRRKKIKNTDLIKGKAYWGQSRRGTACPGKLCSFHSCRFSRSHWIKCWATWCDLIVKPAFSRRWNQRPPEVPSLKEPELFYGLTGKVGGGLLHQSLLLYGKNIWNSELPAVD